MSEYFRAWLAQLVSDEPAFKPVLDEAVKQLLVKAFNAGYTMGTQKTKEDIRRKLGL